MTDREHFERIRDRFLASQAQEHAYRRDALTRKYGQPDPPRSWMTRGEQAKLETFKRAQNRESDKLFALLDRIGGRPWGVGVPWWWVMRELTFDDAVTTDELSVIPPVPFGSSRRDVERFAQAILSVEPMPSTYQWVV